VDEDMAQAARRGERRKERAHFVIPERRTGYDRRRPAQVLRTLSESPALLLTVLVAFNVLSMVDWFLTLHLTSSGAAEANLAVWALMSKNLMVAGALKAAAVLAVSFAIWRWRRYRLVVATALVAVAIYACLIVYELAGLVTLRG